MEREDRTLRRASVGGKPRLSLRPAIVEGKDVGRAHVIPDNVDKDSHAPLVAGHDKLAESVEASKSVHDGVGDSGVVSPSASSPRVGVDGDRLDDGHSEFLEIVELADRLLERANSVRADHFVFWFVFQERRSW